MAPPSQAELEARVRLRLHRLAAAKEADAANRSFFATLRASHAFRNPCLVDAMAAHGQLPSLGSHLPPEESGLADMPDEDDYVAMAEQADDGKNQEERRRRKAHVGFVSQSKHAGGRRKGQQRGKMTKEEAVAAIEAAKEAAERASKRRKT
mmetsp:Transcript_7895/g.48812  ORF Transcript_7895/g.48812 Transcript_7895/m.48812 type:complete len:151 (-) Transcript_7895:835-1287(-)